MSTIKVSIGVISDGRGIGEAGTLTIQCGGPGSSVTYLTLGNPDRVITVDTTELQRALWMLAPITAQMVMKGDI